MCIVKVFNCVQQMRESEKKEDMGESSCAVGVQVCSDEWVWKVDLVRTVK